MLRNFTELRITQEANEEFLCVGLDPAFQKIPDQFKQLNDREEMLKKFVCAIIDATADIAGFYKPNIAFYEQWGAEGLVALRDIINYIHLVAPHLPVILDAKRADIGTTNIGYESMAFTYLGADAITVHPYLGREALTPFLEREDKGIFVLCHTSNPGASEFQNLRIDTERKPLYMHIAKQVAQTWNANRNCGLVVGATYPHELSDVRRMAPNLPILIPGIGAQGGDLEASVHAGVDATGRGIIINASRSIIHASSGPDFADAARREAEKLSRDINDCRASKPQY